MILLTSISDLLQLVTGTAVATIYTHASYVDYDGTTVTPGRLNGALTGAATNTLVGSPTGTNKRNVKGITVRNAHASSTELITIQHYDGSITVELFKYLLLAGETLQYFDGQWSIMDAAGGIKSSPAAGGLISVTLLTTASANHTVSARTKSIFLRMVAGGGGGGGGTGGSSTASANGGGSGGGYAEKLFAVTPGTAYAYTCGAGGAAGSGGNGGVGGTTTFVVGGVTVTCNGGLGGIGNMAAGSSVLSILGGASPAISTNGDLNSGGEPGGDGERGSGTLGLGGEGGSTPLGAGANAVNTDVAGNTASVGWGGGGGGAMALTATPRLGGVGAAGAILVMEYS